MLAKTEYTILPFSENRPYLFENATETTLSDKELILIEELFQQMRIEHNAKLAESRIQYNKEDPYGKSGLELETKGFKRQYLPVINEKGEKEVWINFFCAAHLEGSWWKTKRYQVADGGNCYYNLKINLATKEIYNVRINGVA
ncbi:hypothetical protein [uncultured Kordia sp.]|uniref:hypothetical protein n=1 Tax=uncultured Kordia sp. TaxID=507699 RepID=UPI0026235B1B|nr:hypothetical protein [uncultured Kordia sp.]